MNDFPIVNAALLSKDILRYDRALFKRIETAERIEEPVNFGRGVSMRYWCGACNKQVKADWTCCQWCGRRFR